MGPSFLCYFLRMLRAYFVSTCKAFLVSTTPWNPRSLLRHSAQPSSKVLPSPTSVHNRHNSWGERRRQCSFLFWCLRLEGTCTYLVRRATIFPQKQCRVWLEWLVTNKQSWFLHGQCTSLPYTIMMVPKPTHGRVDSLKVTELVITSKTVPGLSLQFLHNTGAPERKSLSAGIRQLWWRRPHLYLLLVFDLGLI